MSAIAQFFDSDGSRGGGDLKQVRRRLCCAASSGDIFKAKTRLVVQ
jgi:hypothetical protein